MGAGLSTTTVNATEEASSFITQQFSGTCDVTCQNNIDGVSVTLIGSNVGGNVQLAQTCSSNPSCMIGSNIGATADTMLKAVNSANAKNAAGWIPSLNIDKTKINSLMDIRQNISQATNQTCNIGSYNEMSDISILAVNSNIGGNIGLYQGGSASGSCSLSGSLSAATAASGQTTNSGQSGKDKLGQKKGSKSGKMSMMSYVLIGIVVIVVIVIIGRMISGSSKSKESAADIQRLTAAKMAAGCLDGSKPLMDPKTGQPLVNPKTHGPFCPPPKNITKPQEINLTITNPKALSGSVPLSTTTRSTGSRGKGGSTTTTTTTKAPSLADTITIRE